MTDPDKLREAIKWAEGQAKIWGNLDSYNYSPYMVEKYTLLATVARSGLQQTKFVEVWHFEMYDTDCDEMRIAVVMSQLLAHEAMRRATNSTIVCKRVTGPHQHEVPA